MNKKKTLQDRKKRTHTRAHAETMELRQKKKSEAFDW